jgi:oligogalacturonide transport system substrate-binding protein
MKTTLTALALVLAASAASAADLRMSWWGGDGRHVATQEALKVCGARFGHTIKPEFMGFEGYLERVTTQLSGGTSADIVQIDWPWLHQFSRDGSGFADLREFSDQIDLSQWTQEQLALTEINGKLNALPVSTTGALYYFNDAIFEKAGQPLPKSWEDLAVAAKVMNQDGVYPFDATKVILMFLIESFAAQSSGKDFIDPATGEIAWTAEDLTRALIQYQWMVDNGVLRSWKEAAGAGNVEIFDDPAWGGGKIGGTFFWTSTYSKFNDTLSAGQLVPVAPLRIEGAKMDGIYKKPSMLFAISNTSSAPEAAAEIVNCLLNDPEAVLILGDSRGLPSSAVALRTLSDAGKIGAAQQEAARILTEATGPMMSPLLEHPSVQEVLRDTIEEFAYGQLTAEEAADAILSGLQRALRRT